MAQADSVHSTPPIITSPIEDAIHTPADAREGAFKRTPFKRIAESSGELYAPTGVSPEEAFRAIGRLRQEAQDEIERLLVFLDATDGDADLGRRSVSRM